MDGMLSVIIPAYNEADIIVKTLDAIFLTLHQHNIPHELIVVDDGSVDHTWEQITAFADQNPNVVAICFSRNFGKEAAIFAGLGEATGDAVAVMDGDLQHPAELLPEMYTLWQKGFEVVEGVKANRGKEGICSRLCAHSFYRIWKIFTHIDLSGGTDFKLMDRKVVQALCSMPERHTFFRGMNVWVGYRRAQIPFEVPPRAGGKTKWSWWRLCRFALNAITSFSSAPLQLVTTAGGIFFVFTLVMGLQTLWNKFSGRAIGGFTTVILLLLMIGSIIMLALGIIGSYLAKIYEELKGRPRYLITRRLDRR